MRYLSKKAVRLFFVTVIVVGVITVGVILFIDSAIKPAMDAIAQVRVRYYAVDIMNNAIKQVTSTEDNIRSIVEVLTNADGSVRLVQTDSVAMNRLSTLVSQTAQEMLQRLTDTSVPVFSAQSMAMR